MAQKKPKPTQATAPGVKRRRWPYVVIAVMVLVVMAGITAVAVVKSHRASNTKPVSTPTALSGAPQPRPPLEPGPTIRIIASGDELPHSALTAAAKTGDSYDYTPFFKTIKPVFQAADIRFCNQEAVSAGEEYGITGYPGFNVSKQFARNLYDTGCNVVSLANNHMNDKGSIGINETLSVWEEIRPLAFAGVNRSPEEQARVRYFEVKGVKFAFVSYTALSNTDNYEPYALNMLHDELVTAQLTEARAKADIVLVSVHWGTEYTDVINTGQDKWSARFAALNADVVLGTGPHVLQPVKNLARPDGKQTLVWYSLGNMLSAQLDTPSLIGGFGVMEVDVATKSLKLAGFLPTYMHYEWTHEQKAAEDLLSRRAFQIYPLDKAVEPLAKSQAGTTVEAQTTRIQKLLSMNTQVPILSYDQYMARR